MSRTNIFNLEKDEDSVPPYYREVRLGLGLKPKQMGQGLNTGQDGAGAGGENESTKSTH